MLRFDVFTVVKIQVVFWVVMLCSVVVGYRCFRGYCCLHLQGDFTATIQCHNSTRPWLENECNLSPVTEPATVCVLCVDAENVTLVTCGRVYSYFSLLCTV